MEKFRIYFIAVLLAGTLSLLPNLEAKAAVAEGCGYTPVQGTNPDFSTMNCLLTETALEYDVPPEVVKAIADVESGNWQHFDENGDVIVTADGGIGVMQLTNQAGYDQDRLENDIVYNIQAGVETLDNMFDRGDLPVINGGDRDIIEHWYFAIMAYNGIKPVNSPIVQATGEQNTDAYQEKVMDVIEDYGLVDVQELPFSRSDFTYDSSSSANIEFDTMHFSFDFSMNETKHQFSAGQRVGTTAPLALRTGPTTNSTSKATLREGEKITIDGSFEYEEVRDRKNHFVWYPVTRSNGTNGYVASSYLEYRFHDVPADHYAEDSIYYLYKQNLLAGVGGDRFGLGQNLTRWQAVLLLNRAENISLDNRPDPGFTDVPRDHSYYRSIAAAVDAGLFSGVTDTEFRPGATLTRSQMAVLLDRIYDFPAGATVPFTDVKRGVWYTDAIDNLYGAGITAGISESRFGPQATVTREQFAAFLARSMNDDFRTD